MLCVVTVVKSTLGIPLKPWHCYILAYMSLVPWSRTYCSIGPASNYLAAIRIISLLSQPIDFHFIRCRQPPHSLIAGPLFHLAPLSSRSGCSHALLIVLPDWLSLSAAVIARFDALDLAKVNLMLFPAVGHQMGDVISSFHMLLRCRFTSMVLNVCYTPTTISFITVFMSKWLIDNDTAVILSTW